MSKEKRSEKPKESPLPPDRRGVDAGTWGLIILTALLTLAVIAWAAYGGSLGPPPEQLD